LAKTSAFDEEAAAVMVLAEVVVVEGVGTLEAELIMASAAVDAL
jgi:hypothetical protein